MVLFILKVNHFCGAEAAKGELIEKSTGQKWIIPTEGKLIIEMTYDAELPTSNDVGEDEGVDKIIYTIQQAKTDQQKELVFKQAVNSPYYFLTADQSQLLYDEIIQLTSVSKIEIMAEILPQIVNKDHCLQFLDHNLDASACLGYLAARSARETFELLLLAQRS